MHSSYVIKGIVLFIRWSKKGKKVGDLYVVCMREREGYFSYGMVVFDKNCHKSLVEWTCVVIVVALKLKV
jgi:hypothetical protein